jgi:Glycosyltransferase
MIKIGIYDRYLSTAGGGERYSCKMAEILSAAPGYEVELISDLYVDLNFVASRLNLDLNKVGLKIFPFLSEEYTKRITSAYDIFINTTYLSSLSGYGKRNLYLCYFPTPFNVDFKFVHRFLLLFFRLPAIWLYRLADKISRGFKDIEIVEGIYDIKRFLLMRGSWSSGTAVIDFHNPGKNIKIALKNPNATQIENMDCEVRLYEKSSKNLIFDHKLTLGKGEKKFIGIDIPDKLNSSLDFRMEIKSTDFIPSETAGLQQKAPALNDTRKLGAVIYNGRETGLFKKLIMKILGFVPLFLVTYPKDLKFLDTYNTIIAISEYSQKWIRKFWKKESTILFPPVDTENFQVLPKEKIILSAGRFFPEHHNKKQLELAKNFIELLKQNPDIMAGFTLYLVGGVENKKEHLDYIKEIEDLSKDYPIKIITNMQWEKLAELFSKALIFWHASGMGEDENRHPEKFEHFGITTVEAMASGCIPVVINKGGQVEIIQDGYNGFLFESWEQMNALTLKICAKPDDYANISQNALTSSKNFSSDIFRKQLISIIKEEN